MRLLKKFTLIILTLTVILFALIYFYQKNVSDNLNQSNKNLTKAWNSFSSSLITRDSLITGLTLTNFDNLKYWLQKSIVERKKKENNLNLVFYEYKIDKIIMDSFLNQKQIVNLNIKLNNEIEKYNSLTQQYNKYISIFPNFIIAKRHNYHRANFFTISYGEVNRDPIEKSKEIPEWAKGVDTI